MSKTFDFAKALEDLQADKDLTGQSLKSALRTN